MPESDAGSVGLIVFQMTVFWFCLTVVECFISFFIPLRVMQRDPFLPSCAVLFVGPNSGVVASACDF